jgi:putative nucleotidyltransferase with HDIG domain
MRLYVDPEETNHMPTVVQKTSHAKPRVLNLLPPFPPIALRLLDILAKDEVETQEIITLVRKDPAFSASILRLANSASYGFRSQIDSLGHAIVLLGTQRVMALTLTVAVGSYGRLAFRIEALKKCWHHSLATALLSEEIASACSINRDRAYTAGLLHDLGRLTLLVGYPTEYANMIAAANEKEIDVLEAERAMFDADHHEVGMWLAQEWKLPEDLVDLIGRPDVAATDSLDFKKIIRLGCHLANTLGFFAIAPRPPKKFEDIMADLPDTVSVAFPSMRELTQLLQDHTRAILD